MRVLHILSLLVCCTVASFAQSMSSCTDEYTKAFNDIQMQQFRKELSRSKADSLLEALEPILNNCLSGAEFIDFEFRAPSGKVYTKDDLKGKVVMLNIWDSHCGPCIGEIPVLNRLNSKYANRSDFVLLSLLMEKEDALNRRMRIDGKTLRDIIEFEVVAVAEPFRKDKMKFIKIYPTHLFLDRDGKIFARATGGIADQKYEAALEDKLTKIIESGLDSN